MSLPDPKPIGKSGGRSRNHRTGAGAIARATSRERDGIDPPGHREWSAEARIPEQEAPRAVLMNTLIFLALTAWLVLCVVIGVEIAL